MLDKGVEERSAQEVIRFDPMVKRPTEELVQFHAVHVDGLQAVEFVNDAAVESFEIEEFLRHALEFTDDQPADVRIDVERIALIIDGDRQGFDLTRIDPVVVREIQRSDERDQYTVEIDRREKPDRVPVLKDHEP